jgi:hypothetical protein
MMASGASPTSLGRRRGSAASFLRQSVCTFALGAILAAGAAAQVPAPSGQVIRVGPNRALSTIAAAARVAMDGDTVEVDAGEYIGDVAVWAKNNLTLKAVGGRVKLVANQMAAEQKGIWVVRGEKIMVQGFDFTGATVPSRNGAGIRFEKGSLLVRDCTFIANENGILTGNQNDARLEIENSEFGQNGFGDGQSHNVYVGEIAYLSVSGSYFHHAKVGHLLKTRAAVNDIRYNRLTDEADGQASYELEFAAGGVAYVVGNIIQQSPQTNNPHLVSYGAEGYKWPTNELYLINNTMIDDRAGSGVFLRVRPGAGTVRVENNLMVGAGSFDLAAAGGTGENFRGDEKSFVTRAAGDFRLRRGSPLIGRAAPVAPARDVVLSPDREYLHPARTVRISGGNPKNPGAFQTLGK